MPSIYVEVWPHKCRLGGLVAIYMTYLPTDTTENGSQKEIDGSYY
jgi:hypothetical protein